MKLRNPIKNQLDDIRSVHVRQLHVFMWDQIDLYLVKRLDITIHQRLYMQGQSRLNRRIKFELNKNEISQAN